MPPSYVKKVNNLSKGSYKGEETGLSMGLGDFEQVTRFLGKQNFLLFKIDTP